MLFYNTISLISYGYIQEFTSSPGACDPLCSVDETSWEDFEASYQPKTDLLKALAVLAAAGTGALAINHSWVAANQVPYPSLNSIAYKSMALPKVFVGLIRCRTSGYCNGIVICDRICWHYI